MRVPGLSPSEVIPVELNISIRQQSPAKNWENCFIELRSIHLLKPACMWAKWQVV